MKVLQIHPTLKCNMQCVFCTYEKKDIELPIDTITEHLNTAVAQGYRILKISGGGEPTLYSQFTFLLAYAKLLGFKIYLQTNGSNLSSLIRESCDDIRISFGDGNPFKEPEFHPDGFSYVITALQALTFRSPAKP